MMKVYLFKLVKEVVFFCVGRHVTISKITAQQLLSL